jgi:hypothetical protein
MRYAPGIGERGRPIDVRDPLLKSFRKNFTALAAMGIFWLFRTTHSRPVRSSGQAQ